MKPENIPYKTSLFLAADVESEGHLNEYKVTLFMTCPTFNDNGKWSGKKASPMPSLSGADVQNAVFRDIAVQKMKRGEVWFIREVWSPFGRSVIGYVPNGVWNQCTQSLSVPTENAINEAMDRITERWKVARRKKIAGRKKEQSKEANPPIDTGRCAECGISRAAHIPHTFTKEEIAQWNTDAIFWKDMERDIESKRVQCRIYLASDPVLNAYGGYEVNAFWQMPVFDRDAKVWVGKKCTRLNYKPYDWGKANIDMKPMWNANLPEFGPGQIMVLHLTSPIDDAATPPTWVVAQVVYLEEYNDVPVDWVDWSNNPGVGFIFGSKKSTLDGIQKVWRCVKVYMCPTPADFPNMTEKI